MLEPSQGGFEPALADGAPRAHHVREDLDSHDGGTAAAGTPAPRRDSFRSAAPRPGALRAPSTVRAADTVLGHRSSASGPSRAGRGAGTTGSPGPAPRMSCGRAVRIPSDLDVAIRRSARPRVDVVVCRLGRVGWGVEVHVRSVGGETVSVFLFASALSAQSGAQRDIQSVRIARRQATPQATSGPQRPGARAGRAGAGDGGRRGVLGRGRASLLAVAPSAEAATAGRGAVTTSSAAGRPPASRTGPRAWRPHWGRRCRPSSTPTATSSSPTRTTTSSVWRPQSTGTFYGHAMTAGHLYTIVGNGVAGDIGDGSSAAAHRGRALGPQRRRHRRAGRHRHHRHRQRRRALRARRRRPPLRPGDDGRARSSRSPAVGRRATSPRAGRPPRPGSPSPDGVAFDAAGRPHHRRHRQRPHPLRPGRGPHRLRHGRAARVTSTRIAGNMNYGYTGNGGPGTSAELQLDTFNGVAVDSKGDVVFSDVDNQVVRLVAAATGTAFGQAGHRRPHLHARRDRDRGVQGRQEARHQGLARHAPGGGRRRGGQPLHQRLGQQPDPPRARPPRAPTTAWRSRRATSTPSPGRSAGYSATGAGHAVQRPGRPERGGQRRPARRRQRQQRHPRDRRHAAGPTPTVTAIKPTSGPTSGDRKVTIIGSNLSGTTAVMFGSRPARASP